MCTVLATSNMDKLNHSTSDLWVDPDKWEFISRLRSIRAFADNSSSAASQETHDSPSNYEGSDYKEDEDVGEESNDEEECKAMHTCKRIRVLVS